MQPEEARGSEEEGAEAPPRRSRRRRVRRTSSSAAPPEPPSSGAGSDVVSEGEPSAGRTRRRRRRSTRKKAGGETAPGDAAPAKKPGPRRRKAAREREAAAEIPTDGPVRKPGRKKRAKKAAKKAAKKKTRKRTRKKADRGNAPPAEEREGGEASAGAAAGEEEGVAEAVAATPAEPTEKILLVNAVDPEEVRIALLEDRRVEELYVEAAEERSATGNVYRGRVQNVERGIGAAFVDLGRGLTGFLHVSDLPNRPPKAVITDLVEPGQEILVQITRDSIGKKGPALTGRISLPGRYLVLLTTSDRSGVSRRIGKGGVRERARRFLEDLELPEGMGVIVRTAGEDSRLEDLRRDLDHLVREWRRLEALATQSGPPALLRAESDVAERAIRDIMPTDTERIVVDREDLAARVRTMLTTWYGPIPLRRVGGDDLEDAPEAAEPRPMPEVVVHEGPMPLFHDYGVETQLEEAFRRAVRLPSGGSIVIDPTEALVAVDVNSGRYTGEEDPESTALATNLEAASEVGRQLRLRDLGGLIVLDLIDMRSRRDVRKVEKALKQALARDRARIRLGRIGPFGCLILSRQRVRQALSRVTHADCPECGGTGRRRHPAGLGLRVLREMQARAARAHGRGGLEVRVPRSVREWILRHRASLLREIEEGLTGPLELEGDERLAADGWAMKGLPPGA